MAEDVSEVGRGQASGVYTTAIILDLILEATKGSESEEELMRFIF